MFILILLTYYFTNATTRSKSNNNANVKENCNGTTFVTKQITTHTRHFTSIPLL